MSRSDDRVTRRLLGLVWLGVACAFLSGGSKTIRAQCDAPLSPSDVMPSDNFGISVALSGNVAIVGAPLHDALGTNAGAAYVFLWNGTTWVQQQVLFGSDETAYDLFGKSIAIDGDTAVVVAPGKYINSVPTGATYVFRFDGSNWVQQQRLPVGVSGTDDAINASVSVSGDVIVVGNSLDVTRGFRAGAAYVFYWNGSTWVQTPKLFASDAAGADFFGYSVAAFDDWVVVGAWGDDDKGIGTGSAYAFKRNDNGTPSNSNDDFWEQTQKLVPADGVANNGFGKSVAIDGATLVIGADQDKDSGLSFGSAYVYRLPPNESIWIYETELYGSNSSTNGYLGGSVAVSGDTIVVGAYKEDLFWQDGGSAYVFRKSGPTWREETRLEDPDAYARNYFGCSVAVSNGHSVVGSYLALGTGTANDFDLLCSAPRGDADLLDFAAFQNCFGLSPVTGICLDLDLNNDGEIDLLDFADLQAAFLGQ